MNDVRNLKKRRIIICGVLLLAVCLCVFFAIYRSCLPSITRGDKNISVQVTYNGQEKEFKINTDEEFLGTALENEGIVSGRQTQYGLFVITVDGYTANESASEWWRFTKDGETLFTGVDTTPIEDGDQFEISLETGW